MYLAHRLQLQGQPRIWMPERHPHRIPIQAPSGHRRDQVKAAVADLHDAVHRTHRQEREAMGQKDRLKYNRNMAVIL